MGSICRGNLSSSEDVMPTQAGRPCNNRTCSGIVRGGVCSKCGSQRRGSDKALDDRRGTAAQRGYDATWHKLRRMQLSREPLCRDCSQEHHVTLASEVHHIIAKRNGGEDSFNNLMSLCKTHHSRRTARGE
jgi:5-methylcytosine-specific restriction protein A